MATAVPRPGEVGGQRSSGSVEAVSVERGRIASAPRASADDAYTASSTDELVALHRLAERGLTACEIGRLAALRERLRRV
jgi:hypothetical protein